MKNYSEEEIEAQNEQIVELIHQGLTRREIAKEVGISISTLHSRIAGLRLNGILPYYSFLKGDDVPAIKGFPTIKEQEFLDLYAEGLKAEEIAQRMHITMGSVKVYLQRLRIKGFLPPKINVRIRSARFKRVRSEIEGLVDEFLHENDEFFINEGAPGRKSAIVVDITKVAEIVKALGYRDKDVSLLAKLYIERGLYEDAIALLCDYESNNELSPKKAKQVADLKHSLRLEMLKKLTGSVPHYLADNGSSRNIDFDFER